MVRRPIFVIALAFIPALAQADCEAEAIRAREKIFTSGPFQYSTRIWDYFSIYDWKKVGLIDPNKAEHVQETVGNNDNSRKYKYREMIIVGKQRWEKGDVGWFLPTLMPSEALDHDSVVPDPNEQILSAKCLGQVQIDGKSLTAYELKTNAVLSFAYTLKLFVEPSTGLTVRYERTAPGPIFDLYLFNVISTYRYDTSIKIKPPKVDVNDFPPSVPAQEEVTGRPRNNAATKF